jgi:prepilin-type N-terminal cleavage/methylation domain-containing protein
MIQKLNTRRGGFTLVEIMIVVAIIALLAAIAVPGFLRARKRSQATQLLNSLRLIDAAKDQYAIEYNKSTAMGPSGFDLQGYLKPGSALYNAAQGAGSATTFADPKINAVTYNINSTDALPGLIGASAAYSDVVDGTFWSPYTAN